MRPQDASCPRFHSPAVTCARARVPLTHGSPFVPPCSPLTKENKRSFNKRVGVAWRYHVITTIVDRSGTLSCASAIMQGEASALELPDRLSKPAIRTQVHVLKHFCKFAFDKCWHDSSQPSPCADDEKPACCSVVFRHAFINL